MRQVTIKQENLEFRVVGTGRWADYGDSWLIAHDILHHEPTDSGTFWDEVRSFGTQIWIEQPSVDELRDYAYTLAAVMQDCYAKKRTAKFFHVPSVAPEQAVTSISCGDFPVDRAEFIRQLVAIAIADFLAPSAYTEKDHRKFKFMDCADYTVFMVSSIELGYLRASARFSSPYSAKALFNKLVLALKEAGRIDLMNIHCELDEKAGTLKFKSRLLRDFD